MRTVLLWVIIIRNGESRLQHQDKQQHTHQDNDPLCPGYAQPSQHRKLRTLRRSGKGVRLPGYQDGLAQTQNIPSQLGQNIGQFHQQDPAGRRAAALVNQSATG